MPLLTLSIGSNVDSHANVRVVEKALRARYPDLTCSTVYESESVGFEGDNFLNLVACAETDESLIEINDFLKGLEEQLGRDRSQPKFSARTMDIDILTYGDLVGEHHGIQLPREEIVRHAFVLQPLANLLPDQTHPSSGESYAELWEKFDQSSQKLWPINFDWQELA